MSIYLLLLIEDKNIEHWDTIFSLVLNITFMYLDDFTETPYQDSLMQQEIDFLKNLALSVKENRALPIAENE